MNNRYLIIGVFATLACVFVTWSYLYWVTFMHWHQAYYAQQQLCFNGRYTNWSVLEYEIVLWSRTNDSPDPFSLVLELHEKSYQVAELTPSAMQELGADLISSGNERETWQRIPTPESRFHLVFTFESGRLVGFSMRRYPPLIGENETDVYRLMINHEELALPITDEALGKMLGPPEITGRNMVWP